MSMPSVTLPSQPQSAAEIPNEASPFIVEFYFVQALGYRGMAYCDPNGIWRAAFTGDELMGRVYLVE